MLTTVLATLTLAPQMSANDLAALARKSALAAVEKFKDKKVQEPQLGITVGIVDRNAKTFTAGSFRGNQAMYPASVVKMFYLAYAAELLEQKKLTLTPEFDRAIRDMIVESSNDATGLVLDAVTDTTGGPELPPDELKAWMEKRRAVNRWYVSMGYEGVNANQKTWNEGPYGRERQGYGPSFEFRNMLTPDACARLMSEIALDKIVTPEKCAWMRGFLKRTPVADGEADYQSRAFTGKIVPKGTKLYSKAGYTSTVRHDVAYIVLPNGREAVLAIFTKDQSETEELIPFIATELVKGISGQ